MCWQSSSLESNCTIKIEIRLRQKIIKYLLLPLSHLPYSASYCPWPASSIYGKTFIIFIASLNSWCPLVSHFFPNLRLNAFIRMKSVCVKKNSPRCPNPGFWQLWQCHNVSYFRGVTRNFSIAGGEKERNLGIWEWSGECCPLQFLLWIKNPHKTFRL